MKHAGPDALDLLDDVIAKVRALDGPRERSRGVFYLRSDAFLHFHEDPAGLFADVKRPKALGGGWDRMRVSTATERAGLLSLARKYVRVPPRVDRRGRHGGG